MFFKIFLLIINFYLIKYITAECSQLIDGISLNFVNQKGINLLKSESERCLNMLTCDVLSAPSETIVEWIYNGKIVYSNSAEEFNLIEEKNRNQLGLSETSHRICFHDLLASNGGNKKKKRSIFGFEADIRCRVRLACNPLMTIESEPFDLLDLSSPPSTPLSIKIGKEGKRRRNRSLRTAPSISLITSSRMEIAGSIIKLMCKANGDPEPKIDWNLIAVDGNELIMPRSIEEYPFITDLNNGDLLVDTKMTEHASFTLQCRASNCFGNDLATSTVILLRD
ncbi:hypothetical protein Mgra_00010163 [Meloidogyne graminicola]|uniref:Ig-like domain-containing protein n=1 Tax=Meloidogyne graminicola TaxID=189291 RepID=A0A8S9ZA54_9BILA|nr:hypothetical protein Mgra_00010163 [Meloidogyne graminicola]